MFKFTHRIPAPVYLWLAVIIFGASSAVTRKIAEIGDQHFVGGQNPISLCNVLFVGNLCALLVMVILYGRQFNRTALQQISRAEWLSLVVVALLAGALAPGLIFQALATTPVTNVILIGRVEPPLTLALSIWLLRERIHFWEILGAVVAGMGVALAFAFQSPPAGMSAISGFHLGQGEFLSGVAAIGLAIATIVGKKWLSAVPLGIYNIVRTGIGTIVFFFVALKVYGPDHFMGVLSPFLWQWMLVYGVILVVVGQSFWTTGLRATSVSTALLIGSFAPIVGVLAAYLILGEVPTPAQYSGGTVIILGLFLGQIGNKSRTARQDKANSMEMQQAITTKVGFKGV